MGRSKIAAALVGIAALFVAPAAMAQASGGGTAQMYDGFGNPIGSTGSGTSRAINMTCTNCGGSGGGPFPQSVSGTVNSGGIPCFVATTIMQTSALLGANQIVVGGGVGACPSTATTGSGILTALGVPIGSAGAPILFNGAGGTPSSINLANATNIPAAQLAGNVPIANLAGGAGASSSTFLRGDNSWQAAGGGSGVSSLSTTCPTTGPLTGAVTLANGVASDSKTASFNPVAADCGKWFEVNSSSAVAVTLPAYASVGQGYAITIQNLGTGLITLTPNGGTGLINGSPTATIAAGNSASFKTNFNGGGTPNGWDMISSTAAGASGVSSVSTTCPATGPSTGAVILSNGLVPTTKTANYTALAADCGGLISANITTAITLTLPAPGTVGTGWGLSVIQNLQSSTANLAVAPASGNIAGAASLSLPPGSSIGAWVDAGGTQYFTTNGVGWDILVFTASGTWTPNPSFVRGELYCMGGGGGAGAGGATNAASTLIYGGGSGGSASSKRVDISLAQLRSLYSTTVPVTVGTGGAGGGGNINASGSNGAIGGNASIGSGTNFLCSAFGGGQGGGGGTAGSAGGGGGGLQSAGVGATQNSTSGGVGGLGGATPGVASAFNSVSNWCAGSGGVGGFTTTAAAHSTSAGLCTTPGPSGGGVSAAGAVGGVVGGQQVLGVSANNSIYGAGAAGAAGGTGQWADGTFARNGVGLIGGSSGGSGGGCVGSSGACVPTAGGAAGFGSGGAGGGGCDDTGGCTGGAGGAGGPAVVQIVEYMTP